MTRISMIGAAFALLVSSTAIAQTNPPAGEIPIPPVVDQMAPSAEAPLMPGDPQPDIMGFGP